MFGYEGEGYLRGAGRDVERWDYESGYDRPMERGHGVSPAGDTNWDHPSYRGRGPKNYRRSDERIYEDVCERLGDEPSVDATDIEVSVREGIVTLSGSVRDRVQKRRAEDVARAVRGVKDVQSDVRIG